MGKFIDIQGQTFNRLTAIEHIGGGNWRCRCYCGNEIVVEGAKLRLGYRKSCGCLAKDKMINIRGQRFGQLVAKEYVSRGRWKCICDCGNETIATPHSLRNGLVVSCGCYKNLNLDKVTHGQSGSTMYKIWMGMLARCYNPSSNHYDCYGGRGIKVCERWRGKVGFENFMRDMGERPSAKHSIDRIDNNGDYCPENCRWATQKEQCNNQRKTIRLIHNDIEHSIGEWAEIYGISRILALGRYYKGFSFEEIFSTISLQRSGLTDEDVRFIRAYKGGYESCKSELNKDFKRNTFYNIRKGKTFKYVI